jgi:choline kinase
MRAIVLAAGLGRRLGAPGKPAPPKCLLRFEGVTLLERHLRLLRHSGVGDVVVGVGYGCDQIAEAVKEFEGTARPVLVFNPDYEIGSVMTLNTLGNALECGDDVLLMDADVLYDQRMLASLEADDGANRLLMDRDFDAGEEPVKLCLRNGRPVELRKKIAADLAFDTQGESVGFFRFAPPQARRLAQLARNYVIRGDEHAPHEEAVRDLLLGQPEAFDTADITGLPWLEIDFPEDIERARRDVLPRLLPLPERA